MSIYLTCIIVLIALCLAILLFFSCVILINKIRNSKVSIDNLLQKKSSLYIRYYLNKNETIINNYSYLNIELCQEIIEVSKSKEFNDNVKKIIKNKDKKFSYAYKKNGHLLNVLFSYRDNVDDEVILRCDYCVEKIAEPIELKSIDEIKKIHSDSAKKNAVFYYLNVKDFNSLNQRYGQECGDYILEIIKKRLYKYEKNGFYCSYLGSDQFSIYYNKNINKKKALKIIKKINKRITKPIDIGHINIVLVVGYGICLGKYDDLQDFIKCAYIASDYAKKRKKYNIVIYNENMELEKNIISSCEKELEDLLKRREVSISYNPVYYHNKSKFVGYISSPIFSNSAVSYEKIKSVAVQKDLIDQLMNVIIDYQLLSYIKKRPNKSSKLFINLKLEDLSNFLELYLSNPSYRDSKIVICLNVKKGYEMINKFSNISNNISRIIEEGIEIALEINYSIMYDYDYILKNAKYLILDNSITGNMNNVLIKSKMINIAELANNYELELVAVDINEYIQFEMLLKYDVHYFSGLYFGKGVKKPNDLEQTKTRIFARLLKDSKKNKKN